MDSLHLFHRYILLACFLVQPVFPISFGNLQIVRMSFLLQHLMVKLLQIGRKHMSICCLEPV